MICDIRISKSVESIVREEWEARCLFSLFSSQARGVAIFIKKDNPAKILDNFMDTDGNMLAILLYYEGKRVLLQSVYGPNQDNLDFFKELVFKKLND